jgi:hypothetical protein
MKEAAPSCGLCVNRQTYCSALVLVKVPLLPFSFKVLFPDDTIEPKVAFIPVPLPLIVDAVTVTLDPAELVWIPFAKLSTMLDSSMVKKTWVASASDAAGWLFLAVGVAADLVALVLPFCVTGLWQSRKSVTAPVGWAVCLLTFVFAVTASIGFASTNISDVTLVRASRVTPAVTSAQAALTDAIAARDRERKGGVGKFCREREVTVAERRQVLDSVMTSVGRAADPQTVVAIGLVA